MSTQLLRACLSRPIAFHPVLARLTGRATAGLFLSQLIYWCGRSSHEDGWVYKDSEEWEAETTLSKDEQRGARKVLEKLAFIQVGYASKHFPQTFNKFDKTFCYRIDFDRLVECLEHENGPQTSVVTEGRKFPLRESEIPTSRPGNSHSESRKFPPLTTEITTETTTTPYPLKNGGGDVEEMVLAAVWTEERAGRKIVTRGRWEARLRERLARGFSPADLADLAEYRKAMARTAEHAQRTAAASAPPKFNPATAAADRERLEEIDRKRKARTALAQVYV